MRVAVVGGGLAGLAAALELVDAGEEVVLHEARPTLGGAVQTLPAREGDPEPPPDNGQHIALGCFTEYLRFLERVGEGGSYLRTRLGLPVLDEHGRAATIEPSLPALLRYGHLPVGDRLRIPLVTARCRNAKPEPGETFGHLLRRLGASDAAIDRFWDVFIRPALNLPADEVDAGAGLFTVRTALLGPRANSDLVLPTRPLGWMHGDAAGRVLGDRVRLDSKVESLDELDADAIVVAVPSAESARLLGEPEPAIEDSPIVSVHLWFDRKLLPQPLAALLGSDAHWVFDRGALTGHEPERGQYLTVVSSGVPELLEVRGRGLVETIAGQLTDRLGEAELLWSRVSREPYATIALRPGVERLGVETSRSNVARAGTWTDTGWPATMESAVRSGRAGGSAHLERPSRQNYRVTVATELTLLDEAIDRGTRRLLELQRPDGVWVGELESNVTMTAQHLFWHHYLGLRTTDLDRRIANELMARMRDDGTWTIWFGGPPDLSISIEAYVACRLAGVNPGPQALAFIQRHGGIPKARLFTKCFMALIGQWPWQRMAPIPPELVLLPPQWPFSIYDFSCWARQTFVALALSQSLRPVRPSDVDLRAIGARPGQTRPPRRPRALRRKAQQTAEHWIRARQEADGSWGGIQPPWVWSIVALAALGHGLDDPTLRRAVDGWQGFMVEDSDRLRPEACQSPVWDTALAALALRACGVSSDHPGLIKAGDYLLREEVTVKGDWAIRKRGLAAGGWAFEYENDNYPDVDDTAVVALTLHELGIGADAVMRGVDWMVGMQSKGGGWGAFDVDNNSMWLYKIPFCDFGKVTDEPTADVTAHSLEVLGALDTHRDAAGRGLKWLLAEQEDDGSWFGRWGVNHLYGTGAALPGLAAMGIPPEHPAMRRAVAWLDSVQQPNGGFGEDIRSYGDTAWRGRADFTTASQTAWALLGYVAAGNAEASSARRAADYLCAAQRPDGDWDEEHFTGTGFPLDFMIRYHLYRITFPLLALGRMRERLAG